MRIAVDVMGGDYAPKEILEGVLLFLNESSREELEKNGIKLYLVGKKEEISRYDFSHFSDFIEIVDARGIFSMDTKPTNVLKMEEDYSLTKAALLVKEGKADAMYSAGNTGAAVAAALFLWGKIEGCKKPGIALRLPGIRKTSIVLDMGAIVDVKPGELLQFAQMARVYAKLLGEENPTVALLSNGAEEAKGNNLLKEVYPLFKEKIPNFIGYVEGTQLYYPAADIVVCDGFVGNIVLKTSEGLVKYFFHLLSEELKGLNLLEEDKNRILMGLAKKLDYQEYGSAVLLGVKGICLIAHGSSRAKAVKNGIKNISGLKEIDFINGMKTELAKLGEE